MSAEIYVNVYIGQTRAAGWIRTLEGYGWGEMCVRGECPPRRYPWAFDNGAFKDWTAKKDFNTKKYEADLDWMWLHCKVRPDFIVVPDRVAAGMDSLRFSESWRPRLEPLGCPLYLVVQDGMELADIELAAAPYAGLFVGGTPAWKLRTAPEWIRLAHRLGKKCHIGRMGTQKKVRAALRWGADSIDSSLPLWSEGNLRSFLKGFTKTGQDEFPGLL